MLYPKGKVGTVHVCIILRHIFLVHVININCYKLLFYSKRNYLYLNEFDSLSIHIMLSPVESVSQFHPQCVSNATNHVTLIDTMQPDEYYAATNASTDHWSIQKVPLRCIGHKWPMTLMTDGQIDLGLNGQWP